MKLPRTSGAQVLAAMPSRPRVTCGSGDRRASSVFSWVLALVWALVWAGELSSEPRNSSFGVVAAVDCDGGHASMKSMP